MRLILALALLLASACTTTITDVPVPQGRVIVIHVDRSSHMSPPANGSSTPGASTASPTASLSITPLPTRTSTPTPTPSPAPIFHTNTPQASLTPTATLDPTFAPLATQAAATPVPTATGTLDPTPTRESDCGLFLEPEEPIRILASRGIRLRTSPEVPEDDPLSNFIMLLGPGTAVLIDMCAMVEENIVAPWRKVTVIPDFFNQIPEGEEVVGYIFLGNSEWYERIR